MAADVVEIGPFTGGLNNASDSSSIGDVDLTRLVNLELDFDGALTSRPPIEVDTLPLPTGDSITVLGFYSLGSADYLIANDGDTRTYSWNGTAWTLITALFAATDFVQYRDEIHLLHNVADGGVWDNATFTQDTDMPQGTRIVLFKERLWISNGTDSRVYVSDFDISNPVLWNNDFITVSGGDGETVLDLIPYFDTLVIFKEHSTYRFSYESNPALGAIVLISDSIGITATGCAVAHENSIFTMYRENVYDFTNYQFLHISDKINLESSFSPSDYTTAFALSVWADRLFVAFKGLCYVYGLRTKTWSEWVSPVAGKIGRVFSVPNSAVTSSGIIDSFASATTDVPSAEYRSESFATSSEPFIWTDPLLAGASPGDIMLIHYRSKGTTALAAPPSIDGEAFSLLGSIAYAPNLSATYVKELTSDDISHEDISVSSAGASFTSAHLFTICLLKNVTLDDLEYAESTSSTATTAPEIVRALTEPTFSVILASGHTTYSSVTAPPAGWDEEFNVTDEGIQAVVSHKVVPKNGTLIAPGLWDATSPPSTSSGYVFLYQTHVNFTITQSEPQVAFKIINDVDSVDETFTCYVKTKYYDYGNVSRFKRLMWWGIDCILNSKLTATIDPAQHVLDKTWADLAEISWDSVLLFTWDRPLNTGAEIVDTVEVGVSVTGRKFVKFLKSNRFRKISYELEFNVDGTAATLAKIFKIVTVIGQKAKVPKRVN